MDKDTTVQLYRSMFANMRDGLAIVHLEAGEHALSPRLVEMNPAAREISGSQAESLDEGNLADYFPGLFDADLPQICARLAGTGGCADLGEVRAGARYFRIRIFELFNHYLGVAFLDVTEHKQAEVEIARLLEKGQKNASELETRVAERTEQLEEINRELDTFAYSVSHDLRAPLRAMQGFAELLLDKSHSETERAEYLKRILTSVHNMDRLIQDLLAYSRLSRQEIMLQTVSLDKVVRDAAQQLELASGGKNYQLEIAGKLPEVVGHHAVLVQVVLNLLTNAVKFVPKGVTPKLRIWWEPAADYCRLLVQDNGIGIAPQHQERIFKIFERLNGLDSYPGTGIGLAIVRKAVNRLGGRIGVESHEGEGSRFWVELPRADSGIPR